MKKDHSFYLGQRYKNRGREEITPTNITPNMLMKLSFSYSDINT